MQALEHFEDLVKMARGNANTVVADVVHGAPFGGFREAGPQCKFIRLDKTDLNLLARLVVVLQPIRQQVDQHFTHPHPVAHNLRQRPGCHDLRSSIIGAGADHLDRVGKHVV